jgi:carbon-monoxide dehydrogenase large subunit
VLFSGKVEVFTGLSPHGQGHETTLSQVVSDVLGVPFEDIEIRHGDTQASPYGLDTYGSRSLTVGGIAIHKAAERLIEQFRPAAAHMLEAAPDDLEYVDGGFRVQGSPEATVSLAEVTVATIANHDLPDDYEPTVTAQFTFEPENWSFPHGTHLCAVEIDTETGETAIRSYVAVDDVGVIVNPQVVEGQVHGGIAQGVAQALWEEAVYDGEGNLVTSSLVDYYVPSAADMPSFVTDHTETPATTNPLGVKGVGETGTIASTPAVVNAVLDAIRHLGVRDIDMPCSPERVWRALQDGAATREHIAPERAEGGQQ